MKLNKLHERIGTALLVLIPLIYAFYVTVLSLSFGKFQAMYLGAGNSHGMALGRTVLHVLLSPGAFAAGAAVVLLRHRPAQPIRWAWGVFAWLWFSMALSVVLAPIFPAWAASQALWALALLLTWRAVRAPRCVSVYRDALGQGGAGRSA
ncbi:hypothetical protein [Achromobacter piechaudii]|uniref:Uncharacterized protein n=1 Tax=Achromobacter piechaudii TaxID=72556 RepID=A0A6S7DRB2_9BURK|nr:hypothetical protein [Achromobacter piechaudii]CAB3879017.1 hypothetical protein LMG1861_03172 [Achromobacter piechaudii]